jgi:hypothetical protein
MQDKACTRYMLKFGLFAIFWSSKGHSKKLPLYGSSLTWEWTESMAESERKLKEAIQIYGIVNFIFKLLAEAQLHP